MTHPITDDDSPYDIGQDTGVPPSGSGHSPEGGAASASPAKPSVPNAASFFGVDGYPEDDDRAYIRDILIVALAMTLLFAAAVDAAK